MLPVRVQAYSRTFVEQRAGFSISENPLVQPLAIRAAQCDVVEVRGVHSNSTTRKLTHWLRAGEL